jgi:beta-N-acetylhexosaminidase
VNWVAAALETGKPVVAVLLGNPRLADAVDKRATLLLAYSASPASCRAAAAALFGKINIRGRLPVHLKGFAYGSGIELPARRDHVIHR